jgi:hypothetical protein
MGELDSIGFYRLSLTSRHSIRNYMSKPWFRDTSRQEEPSQLAGVIAQVLGTSIHAASDAAVANGYAN